MSEVPKIRSITFKRNSNIFLNAGIVGVSRFIERYVVANPNAFPSLEVLPMTKNEFTINCDHLLEFLEEVYYFMGREIYDTATQKQIEENHNIYYIEETDTFRNFPKMNTLGLTRLMTNNAQGGTRHISNDPKLVNLRKIKPKVAKRIEDYCKEQGIKLLAKVYLNEPYTKITRLDIDSRYLEKGNLKCPLTGESFKKLCEAKNISPFLSGITNFNSFLDTSEKKISWKALYLLRFTPVLCYYCYQNSYNTLLCSLFNSNSLLTIDELHPTYLYRQKEELSKIGYLLNYNLRSFKITNKDNSAKFNLTQGAIWESEVVFMQIYTFYKNKFESEIAGKKPGTIDPFADNALENIPISLVSFQANKFSKTLRPTLYEEYNNVKFIIRLLYALESNQIPIGEVWQGLKMKSIKSEALSIGKRLREERQRRAAILANLLRGKSILKDIEKVFFESFKMLINQNNPGYRVYSKLLAFLMLYEKSILFGNNKNMNEILQQRAINLGKSVAYAILNFENPKDENAKKANAKGGRKYVIRLHKARTEEQFTEALIAIMKKYGVPISNEIIEHLNKENFIMVRQYVVIGALNGINGVLSSTKKID